ncbi:hypothetical protein VP01_4235g2 [Puccinia sorghi]|uniref:Uncharacterized protein n=1 Tax=Puccinia sorghi TaxID=27349 RepID=A0A0L6USG7_9BASI|nr:hypothetical protein VP01_4235g2 [Puccinia sorghi]
MTHGKRNPPPEDTKYVKLPSETGKIDIRRDIKELRFSEFKEYVWQAIRKQDALELGDHAEKLENNGLITWLASVPHRGPFAAKNKATIHNDRSFADFIKIVSAPGEESQKNIVTLIEKDLNAVAQETEIVANIQEIHAQNPPCK